MITSAEPASSTLAKSSHTEAAKAEASARAVIPAFAQCGGTGGECGRKDGQPCSDQAYSGYACAPGYTCNREVSNLHADWNIVNSIGIVTALATRL